MSADNSYTCRQDADHQGPTQPSHLIQPVYSQHTTYHKTYTLNQQKMVNISLLAILTMSSLVHALPSRLTNKPTYPTSSLPNSTTITYYQGPADLASNGCGMLEVAKGPMLRNKCAALGEPSMSIARASNADCVFWVWYGTTDCSTGAAGWTETEVARGNGSVCVDSGVLDGGKFETASGMWMCG